MMTTTTLIPVPRVVPSAATTAMSLPAFSGALPIPQAGLIPGFGSSHNAVHSKDSFHSGGNNSGQQQQQQKPVELIRIELTNEAINRTYPKLFEILYDPTSLQCKQCGTRFPGTTEAGRKKNSAHLDWHFRQNKRLRERGGRRAVCREWYLGAETWIKEDLTAVVAATGGDGEEDDDGSGWWWWWQEEWSCVLWTHGWRQWDIQ
ncbi:hypothetical protein BDR26DRAFT_118307 [Obelidium mucronatum]|nr:hypothetical protein BDR26DRAFT_118307 [Obelidium mucronatum]